jgi:hypothetical protein
MYESEDEETEYSFVHPYDDKRCHVRRRSVLERLANNLNDTLNYGHAVGLHASAQLQKLIEEDYESDSSNERITKSKTLNLLIDKSSVCAGGCATNLTNLKVVADEIIESDPCGALVPNRNRDEAYHREERQLKVPIVVHKKASEARVHGGFLRDDITVTSDELYSSDEDSYSSDGSESSYDTESSDESERRSYTREAKLRRKQQFLRRRAMERAAADESDSDEEEREYNTNGSLKYGDKFIYHHAQEVRPKLVESASDTTPLMVNKDDDTTASDCDKTDSSSQDSPAAGESAVSEAAVVDYKHSVLRQLTWEARKATIVITKDQAHDFLATSHIGPILTKLTCPVLAKVLQMGDVIIRLNGEDVSTLDGQFVAELLKRMEGKSIQVTYLRKTMQV